MSSSYFEIFDKAHPLVLSEKERSHHFPFPLDGFQETGIYKIHHNENILVTAHTGSGKTVFAIYAISECIARGQKCIYTSPIKSLSNQKYAEFVDLYGAENVGLLTGDIKMNPTANCVIMTTEILRNMLYKKDPETVEYLERVGVVIFDEIHYINDKDRGKVWEETLILLPPEVILVMLSATIEGADEFAEWVGRTKKKRTMLIPTTHRVVPLRHYIFDFEGAQEILREGRRERARARARAEAKEEGEDGERGDKVGFHWEPSGPPPAKLLMNERNQVVGLPEIRKGYKVWDLRDMVGPVIETLEAFRMTPALFFVFSRALCERLCRQASTGTNVSLVDHTTRTKIREVFFRHMSPVAHLYETLPQYNEIYELVQRGVAYHHSGMLPVLKEIVEILFGMGYIKILFATETFAVGVNMPTKTVIYPSLQKPDGTGGAGMRYVNHAEYMQMSGRAGRRGLDPVGNVWILPSSPLPEDGTLVDILAGKSPRVQSRFVPTYPFVLQFLREGTETGAGVTDFLGNTYYMRNHETSVVKKLAEKKAWEEELRGLGPVVEMAEGDRVELARLQARLRGDGLGPYFVMKRKDQEKLEKEVKKILAKYPGIEASLATEAKRREIEGKIAGLVTEMDATSSYLFQTVEAMKRMLVEEDFVDGVEGTLRKKGLIGMGIHECNELLFAHLLFHYHERRELTYAMWIGIFAVFLQETRRGKRPGESDMTIASLEVPEVMKEVLRELERASTEYMNRELAHGIVIGTEYTLNYEFVEVLYEWAQGVVYRDLLGRFEMYDGNFVKAVLRMQNIVEDVKGICRDIEDYELLQVFENAEVPLVREVAHVHSLYVQ